MSRRRAGPATRSADQARLLAFDALRAVHTDDAYANLVLSDLLAERRLPARDAAFATELVAGSCRMQGSYDVIIEAASGRRMNDLQPALVDLLRIGTHQLLSMRVDDHAAVSTTVDLAAATVGRRVTGLVNAVLRRVAAHDYDSWVGQLSTGLAAADALALRTAHPRWIVDSYADLLPEDECPEALQANNTSPRTQLAVRPGLAEVAELVAAGAQPGRYSPFAASCSGDPARLAAVADGRAGVQDEGSQLAALALARADAPSGPWLDLCAGPGGKTALLTGLARQRGEPLIAGERAVHRARLVRSALRGYPADGRQLVTVADGTRPAWRPGAFARVLADVPCSGLGALRRRPEARWRRGPEAVAELQPLQIALLRSALTAVAAGGVVGYVTCSPHRQETTAVIEQVLAGREDLELIDAPALLPEVAGAASPDRQGAADRTQESSLLQLWPHRHDTDAMFVALIRRRG